MGVDLILLASCLWASMATGLALFFRKRNYESERALLILTMAIHHVAEGKTELSLGEDGKIKLTPLGDVYE